MQRETKTTPSKSHHSLNMVDRKNVDKTNYALISPNKDLY